MNTALLLLAYAFPPENASGAARPFRFFRYLPEFGISPRVITASPQDKEQSDVFFVPDRSRDFPRKSWSWHAERIVRKLILPGEEGLTWSYKAATLGCKLCPLQHPAAILSTSPPTSAHLAAFQIKRKLGIPWVADFRDPMNPSGEIAVSRMKVYSMLESLLFRRADAIIANTDAVFKQWGARYPNYREKLRLIWNGYDPAEVVSPAPIPHRNFKHLVHVGWLYGGRHPGPILDSVERLVKSGRLDPGRLRLSLLGPTTEDAIPRKEVLFRLAEAGIVEYVPTLIPQHLARTVACEADGLLLLQPQSELQVPAKLFEYVRIGRPILAFVKRCSPSDDILSQSGIPYRTIYPEDPPQEIDAKILEFLALPSVPVSPSLWFAEQFNARRQARTLSDIIKALVYDFRPS